MRADAAGARAAGAEALPPPLVALSLRGEGRAVRTALAEALAALEPLQLAPDCRDTVELVLAEVLNNIVEHAYADAPGPIEMELRDCDGALGCVICDHGRPMPDGTPPLGRQAVLDVPLDDLPEGGFGWFLIRSLTRDLDYVRQRGCNRLSFAIPLSRG
jgi:serine/threonine-protein kinase RsbW